ncbi:Rnh70 protein [Pichia kluyveri]|uniref:Rnh70 protein n=1 Tax=Pichia kluyveri TaxID=36015 RepID=A0AAV5R2T8_PICKL|nr:Rnh70 protein [Pichia kluyveri]
MDSLEMEDSHGMHHRVARLSITVDDNVEREKFLLNINGKDGSKEDNNNNNSNNNNNNDDDVNKENTLIELPNKTNNTKKALNKKEKRKLHKQNKKLANLNKKNNESAIDEESETGNDTNFIPPPPRQKRRRSSVAPVIVRKKKFLAEIPKLSILNDRTKKVSVSSIRDLLLYSLTDMNLKPNWCSLINRRSVDKFVIVFLRGLTNDEFGMPILKDEIDPKLINNYPIDDNLSNFNKIFNEVIPMIAPGSKKCIFSTYSSLISYSLSSKQKAAIQKENQNRKISYVDLCLSIDDLIFNNYPIHKDTPNATTELINLTSDFKSTFLLHNDQKLYALDCEMCRSIDSRVLARVSLTDSDNNIIIDKLIKPSEPIVDYVTQYSGITEEQLIGIETTLDDIQNEILSIVSSNDILIGHSLESDLNILKLKHPNIIDTSICFDHPRGPPSKASLKMLMNQHFEKDIQKKISGHDSVEDCISCMELVKLKISKGYLYGKSYNMESLFKRIQQNYKLIKDSNGEKIPKKSVVIGYSNVKNFGHHEKQIQCFNDDEIIDKFIENQLENDLIILKLRELEWFKEYSPNNVVENLQLPKTKEEMLSKVNERIMKIYENLTPNSILVVCSENGDTREMFRLQELSKTFQYKVEKGENDENIHIEENLWNEENAEKLSKALDTARDTLLLCTLKPPSTTSKPSTSISPPPITDETPSQSVV